MSHELRTPSANQGLYKLIRSMSREPNESIEFMSARLVAQGRAGRMPAVLTPD